MPQAVDGIYTYRNIDQPTFVTARILSDSSYGGGDMLICDLTFASQVALKPCV